MSGKFEIKMKKDGKYSFDLLAPNGKVILASALFDTKSGLDRNIKLIKKNASNDKSYKRIISGRDDPYFLLKAENGHVIARSKMYLSMAGMEKGISSVKTNAPDAVIKDYTV